VLAPEIDIKLTRLKVFTFPCPHHDGQNRLGINRNEEITLLSPYL